MPVDIQRLSPALETVLPPLDLVIVGCAVVTKQPKIDPKSQRSAVYSTQQLDEGSDREEKERLHDLDNNVPRAA
jgi:hypothetical protein